MTFRARGIEPQDGFHADGFVVRRLLPSDVEADHRAVMASREFLYHWEQEPPWPAEDFTVAEDLVDLERMATRHDDGVRYTFAVMTPDEAEVLGCVYLLPGDDPIYGAVSVTSHDGTTLGDVDATVSFWVGVATWPDGFERTVLEAVVRWLRDDWSLGPFVVVTNEALDHQIATIESLGLRRAFDFRRDRDLSTSQAYAP
ncbi:MAG: GNAT family protein [Actinomycetota bacterium]